MNDCRGLFLALCLVVGVGAPAAQGAETQVFFAPEDDFQRALVKTLLGAKKSIDVAMYSIHATSRRNNEDYASLKKDFEITPLDAMYEASKKGVKVRMVLSKATSFQWSKVAVAPLIEAGVEVYTTAKTMHEKYAIVDESIVVNGSGNWSMGAFHRYHENWLIFPPNKKLAAAFQRNMNMMLGEKKRVILDGDKPVLKSKAKPTRTKPKKVKLDAESGQVYFTTDNDGEKTTVVEDVIVDHMRKAKKTIDVAIAHYNTKRLADELIKAHERGVKVRCLTDLGEFRNRVSQTRALEKGKVNLRYHAYSFKHYFPFAKLMHHKFMIVDGDTVLNGSYNWSRTAEHKNHENMQVLGGKTFAKVVKTFAKNFETLWAVGRSDYDKFLTRLKAKKGTKEYRKFIPGHFRTMSLSGKEFGAIRRIASKDGYFSRPKKGQKKNNWDFWSYDREKKVGTNEFPPPAPHKPFFDLEQLVITEVCSEPKSQKSGEYVEVYNGSTETIDLAGWRLDDGDAKDTLIARGKGKTTLAPGKVALIVDPDLDGDYTIPKGVVVMTVGNTTLGNGLTNEDVVTLINPTGKVIDTCTLTPKPKKGQVYQRKSVAIPSEPANWKLGAPSPGKHKK